MSIAQDIFWIALLNASMNSRNSAHDAQYADRFPVAGKEEARLWLLSFSAASVPGHQALCQC